MARYKGRHAKRNIFWPTVTALAVTGVVGVGGYFGFIHDYGPDYPLIPQASAATFGQTNEDLCKPFEAKKIDCEVDWKTDEKLPTGELLSQSPLAGTEGPKVTLTYSSGPSEVKMPLLTGFSQEEAEKLLWQSGLTRGEVTEVQAPVAEGAVTSASVNAAEVVDNGTAIDLTISTGTVQVPDWTTKPRELVEAEASELGLKVSFTEKKSSETSGTVIEQSSAGKVVPFDQTIELVIAKPQASVEIAVPDVVGLEQDEAISLLAADGFLKIKTVIQIKKDAKGSKVVKVTPDAGSEATNDTEITLLVERAK